MSALELNIRAAIFAIGFLCLVVFAWNACFAPPSEEEKQREDEEQAQWLHDWRSKRHFRRVQRWTR